MWVTKLLISPRKIRIFCPKLAFLFILGQLIWCPVGGLVGGCGVRAVSRKTPIYFMVMISFQEFSNCLFPLFATPDSNTISQEQWLSQMRTSTPRFLPRPPPSPELIDFTILVTISWEGQAAARAELVDLLEAIAFLICR